ncbi:Imm8 family immunity protein [Clostridium sp. Marseille-Q2269]|uniref:Imm8 family immunity protein n=1 Tax=Clostridium sp. Marseille-Q2269 TaxID=2942205 RepID=UPI0020736DF5|nr:Imm8 family immunity protein [Clostridium sp. Marseille-Q2269]
MKLEIKAYNVINEIWDDIDDFFISCQVDIGFKDEIGAEIYSFDIVSPKKLQKMLVRDAVEIGKGYFIMNDYNKNSVCNKIEKLIDRKISEDNKYDIFDEVSVYFKNQM